MRTKRRLWRCLAVGAALAIASRSGFAAPSAEELLRGVQEGTAPAAPPARSASPPRPRAASSGGSAEDLLRAVQGGETPAPQARPATRTAEPAKAPRRRSSRGDGFDSPLKKARAAAKKPEDTLSKYFVDAQKGSTYAGNTKCIACHKRYGEEGRGSLYALYALSQAILVPQRRGCEGCHGPGSKHADGQVDAITNPRKLTKMGQADLCFSCHAVTERAGDPVVHFPGHSGSHVSCLNCHRIHAPAAEHNLKETPNRLCMSCHRDVAAEFLRRSRHEVRIEEPTTLSVLEGGKMKCIDCHLPWNRRRDPTGVEPTVETCQGCHADTRGPFVFSHDAGSAELSKGCTTCHQPHGSPNRHLLNASGRGLCLGCHTDFSIGHFPGPTCSTMGCHQDIHGSNTNAFLVR